MASEAVHELANLIGVIDSGVVYLAAHTILDQACAEVVTDLRQCAARFPGLLARLRAEGAPGNGRLDVRDHLLLEMALEKSKLAEQLTVVMRQRDEAWREVEHYRDLAQELQDATGASTGGAA